ncbi:MAG: hypothetical protein CL470_05960 [Acidimicrobiaceae bacterium]|nr:hypothetical protein [Acidimicrobiaceae bacterium]
MGIDEEFEGANLFPKDEEFYLMSLYIISLSYDIVRIYYSLQLFIENYKFLIMIFVMMYLLEDYITISGDELKKVEILLTCFILMNNISERFFSDPDVQRNEESFAL